MNPFPFPSPTKHNHNRRAKHHDYQRPAKYMITLRISPYIPPSSTILGDLKGYPFASPTPLGMHFIEALAIWQKQYHQLRMDNFVIMPDHIHFCLNVHTFLKPGLSRVIANLMGKTTKIWQATNPGNDHLSFFQKGFSDSIAYTEEQYKIQNEYINDNPRRLLMKRLYPDLYRRKWIITIAELQLAAVGNIYLLKNPHLQVVRFSRKFSIQEREKNMAAWERCIENGGALISPFIHPDENAMKKQAMEEGGNVIRICENGFSERFAPSGREFDFMGTHHLLLIAPLKYSYQKQTMTYNYAQSLNDIAMLLATHPAEMKIRPA